MNFCASIPHNTKPPGALHTVLWKHPTKNQTSVIKPKNKNVLQTKNTIRYSGLHGTWVRHNKEGFTLIETKDMSDILYYQFFDREIDLGKPIFDQHTQHLMSQVILFGQKK